MQKEDSLKINQNTEGSFDINWDKNDPRLQFMNNLTSEQIQSIIEQTMKDFPT